jgi:hypothetical protein
MIIASKKITRLKSTGAHFNENNEDIAIGGLSAMVKILYIYYQE